MRKRSNGFCCLLIDAIAFDLWWDLSASKFSLSSARGILFIKSGKTEHQLSDLSNFFNSSGIICKQVKGIRTMILQMKVAK